MWFCSQLSQCFQGVLLVHSTVDVVHCFTGAVCCMHDACTLYYNITIAVIGLFSSWKYFRMELVVRKCITHILFHYNDYTVRNDYASLKYITHEIFPAKI